MLPLVPFHYAEFLRNTSWYQHAGEANTKELLYLTLGMVGESGEFADHVKKHVRKHGFAGRADEVLDTPEFRKKALNELGDVLWYVVRMATFFGFGIETLMQANTLKLYERMHATPDIPVKPEWPFTDYTPQELKFLLGQDYSGE